MNDTTGGYSYTLYATEKFSNDSKDASPSRHIVYGENIINNKFVQAYFSIIYTIIFVLGLLGNILVCYVVIRNKKMQTVTNLFTTNLALSYILLCIFAVPFTPLYTFSGSWSWGSLLCHIIPFAEECSIYISTLSLMSIAIDWFFVIIYPIGPRMKKETCIIVIIMMWTFSVTVTLPYAIFMTYHENDMWKFCIESWPTEKLERIFGFVTSILQFVLPFSVIVFCYTCVSFKLNAKAKTQAVSENTRKEQFDKNIKRRTNRMLIVMVTMFGLSWLPLNAIKYYSNYHNMYALYSKYYIVVFFICHVIAMSSTCYNTFIYAWMNDKFRQEFRQLISCIDTSVRSSNIPLEPLGQLCQSVQTFNGDTSTVSYTCSSSQRLLSFRHKRKPSAVAHVGNDGVELNEDNMLTVRDSDKLRLINEDSCVGTSTQSHF